VSFVFGFCLWRRTYLKTWGISNGGQRFRKFGTRNMSILLKVLAFLYIAGGVIGLMFFVMRLGIEEVFFSKSILGIEKVRPAIVQGALGSGSLLVVSGIGFMFISYLIRRMYPPRWVLLLLVIVIFFFALAGVRLYFLTLIYFLAFIYNYFGKHLKLGTLLKGLAILIPSFILIGVFRNIRRFDVSVAIMNFLEFIFGEPNGCYYTLLATLKNYQYSDIEYLGYKGLWDILLFLIPRPLIGEKISVYRNLCETLEISPFGSDFIVAQFYILGGVFSVIFGMGIIGLMVCLLYYSISKSFNHKIFYCLSVSIFFSLGLREAYFVTIKSIVQTSFVSTAILIILYQLSCGILNEKVKRA